VTILSNALGVELEPDPQGREVVEPQHVPVGPK